MIVCPFVLYISQYPTKYNKIVIDFSLNPYKLKSKNVDISL